MNAPTKEVHQCVHCGQHYLKKDSYEKHAKACRKSPSCKEKCFRCVFMQVYNFKVISGGNITSKTSYFCDRLGYTVIESKCDTVEEGSIVMPSNCPLFKQ